MKTAKALARLLDWFIGPDNKRFEHKIVIIFLPINLNMCCGYPKEIFINKKDNYFQLLFCFRLLGCIFRTKIRCGQVDITFVNAV